MRPKVYTTPDAAAATGIERKTILNVASRIGVGYKSEGGTQLFGFRDLQKIKRAVRPVGRPRKLAEETTP
jgi:hypothetical protein